MRARRVAALFLPVLLAWPGPAAAIFGGREVVPSEPLARSMVQVWVKRGKAVSSCSGFVVSETVVVTAAHCIDAPRAAALAQPKPAERPKAERRTAAEPGEVIVRYHWSGTQGRVRDAAIDPDRDVAAILMAAPHPAGYHVPPLDLRAAHQIVRQSRHATFLHLGYGRTAAGLPRELRVIETRPERVAEIGGGRVSVTQAEDIGTCSGDSGAPVLVQGDGSSPKLVGVHTAGRRSSLTLTIAESQGRCSRVGIFHPTSSWHAWLERRMREWDDAREPKGGAAER